MQISFKRTKCSACSQSKGPLCESSPVLRIAEQAASNATTTDEALSLVPEKDRQSIPTAVLDALVTCVAVVGRKDEKRRCRKAKIPGQDYCAAHCDPALLNASGGGCANHGNNNNLGSAAMTKVAARRKSSDTYDDESEEEIEETPPETSGIASILDSLPSFLASKVDSILTNEMRWSVYSIEDSIICGESKKPFPLGMKARKFFTGYGFHDGRVTKICRKQLFDPATQITRPVLVYRMKYNDGDQEDFLHHELTSLRQIYDRCNVPSASPPSLQIPPGTLLETQKGVLRVLEHRTPREALTQDEGGTVSVMFEGSGNIVDLDILKLQLNVLRRIRLKRTSASPDRKKASNAGANQTSPASVSSSITRSSIGRISTVLEWPSRSQSLSSSQPNEKVGKDEQHAICRGLTLRRKRQNNVPFCSDSAAKLLACSTRRQTTGEFFCKLDHPRDVRPGFFKNTPSWDPGNGSGHYTWDPYLTVVCNLCKVDKDDHQLVICDGCLLGFHMYCVRPVMVSIPKHDWLCSRCSTGHSEATFNVYAANILANQDEVVDFLNLPYIEPENFLVAHDEALNLFSPSTHGSKRQKVLNKHGKGVVFHIGSLNFSRDPQKQDWRIPMPLLAKDKYLNSVVSFTAAMKFCGMSSYSEDLLYPESGGAREEMNDCTLDTESIDPMSKKNQSIFLAFKENLKKGAFPPLRVVHSSDVGFSVEALAPMHRHTLIGEYTGEVVTMERSGDTSSDSLMVLLNSGNPSTSLIIDPTRSGNCARFLSGINNRSLVSRRKANVRTRRFSLDGKCRVALFTSRKVEAGEKLHYDYNAGVEGKSAEQWAASGFYDTSNFF